MGEFWLNQWEAAINLTQISREEKKKAKAERKKEAEKLAAQGLSVKEICLKLDMQRHTFTAWRKEDQMWSWHLSRLGI